MATTRDKEATMARILAAAADLIGELGYEEAGVDAIAERAGVAKGTIFYYYESKAGLVEALMDTRFTQMAEVLERAATGESTTQQALTSIVYTLLEFIREHRQFARMLITELWRDESLWRSSLAKLHDRVLIVVRRELERGVARGEIRDDIDPRFASVALFGLVATAALEWVAFEPERPIEEVAQQILGLTSLAAAATAPRAHLGVTRS